MLVHSPSIRLLKHVVRCYLRLCDNPHAKEVLKRLCRSYVGYRIGAYTHGQHTYMPSNIYIYAAYNALY